MFLLSGRWLRMLRQAGLMLLCTGKHLLSACWFSITGVEKWVFTSFLVQNNSYPTSQTQIFFLAFLILWLPLSHCCPLSGSNDSMWHFSLSFTVFIWEDSLWVPTSAPACSLVLLLLFTAALIAHLFHFCRMDTDHHQVPVGTAAENRRVLQTAPRAKLWVTGRANAPGGGTSFEAVGLQRETSHVHVPGEGLWRGLCVWAERTRGHIEWFIFSEGSLSMNRPLWVNVVESSVVEQEQYRIVQIPRVTSGISREAAAATPWYFGECSFIFCPFALSLCRMACWTGMNSWRGCLSALRRYDQERMSFWKCSYPSCCGWETCTASGECWFGCCQYPPYSGLSCLLL